MKRDLGPALHSRQLRVFLVAWRTRSFKQAGRQVFLSSSAVRAAVRSLEEDLQCRLFDYDRATQLLVPTVSADVLAPHAERILTLIEDAVSVVQASAQALHGMASVTPLPTEMGRDRRSLADVAPALAAV